MGQSPPIKIGYRYFLREEMTKIGLIMEERFWEKMDIRGPNECWGWLAGKDQKGYGNFWLKGKNYKAHRVAWELINGEIPEGMWILHHCDNPPCCNPKCLFLGTNIDNVRDRGRKKRQARGISNGQTKLSEEQVLEIRNLRQGGMIYQEIAELYPISYQMVGHICRRKYWQHI